MKTSHWLLTSYLLLSCILTAVLICISFLSSAEAQDKPDKAPKFNPSMIDGRMVNEFRQAWIWSDNGTSALEGLVLITRRSDGSYKAAAQKPTNQNLEFTFKWSNEVVAVVHTHPNKSDPKPLGADLVVGNRFGLPVFTITSRGMYMYDPGTKKTVKVKEGFDWLNVAYWSAVSAKTR